MRNFIVPLPEDFTQAQFTGSIQKILSMNIGEFITVDFLIGTSQMVSKSGTLYFVGERYIVLQQARNRAYVICDIFSIKFVTFLDFRPEEEIQQDITEM